MSVLLVAPPVEVGEAIVARLISQSDQVRVVIERDEGPWRALGAHVAVGDPGDDDLVMRAGQDSRTIVLFGARPDRLLPALAGAAAARIERAIFVLDAGERIPPIGLTKLPGYVVLKAGRSRWGGRRIAAADIARAVDAADDLPGEVELQLDLKVAADWGRLGLSHP